MDDGAYCQALSGRWRPGETKADVFDTFLTFGDLRSHRKVGRKGAPFLAPVIYSENCWCNASGALLSRVHGGRTLEGRLTLQELIRRLRYGGRLDAKEISPGDQSEILEQLIEKLSGGSGKVKLYYIVDRRDFLEKVKSVYARYAA